MDPHVLVALLVCFFGNSVKADVVNGVDVEKACKENAAMARAYCRATEDEPPAVKPKCDLYRKHCSDITPTVSPPSSQCRQIAYCNQYASQNSLICKNAAFANGSSDRQQFCSGYQSMCAKVPEDPDDECGLKNANAAAPQNRAVPNAFSGPLPAPGLNRLTDLNGGGPLATVGQSSLDNIRENMGSSAASAPLFGMLGKFAGMAKKNAASAPGQLAGGDISSIGSGFTSGDGGGAEGGPANPVGPALGIQTLPGFDAASKSGPFGTSPLWVGNNVGVGPFASAGRSTSVNPSGKVGWGRQWGAMGFSGYRGGGVDYGSVPGLTDLNNPLVGGRRRRRDVLKTLRLQSFYRFLYNI